MAGRAVYTRFAVGGAILFALFEAVYFATSHPPYDAVHYLFGWDFVNTWMGGRAALGGHPEQYFDYAHYNAVLHAMFAASLPKYNWSYPPHILLLIWPFGLFPYMASYIAWVAAGLGFYLWSARDGEADGGQILFIALAPVAMVNILAGQNGLFTGAALFAALMNWDRRPVLSGILFGLLTVKPQLVLLVPLVLILTKRWRVFAFATATVAVMFALTSLIYGFHIWRDYLTEAAPFQNNMMTHGIGLMLGMMPTVFINARLMHAPLPLAWTLQAITSALALVATVWTFWKKRDPLLSIAMLLTASLLFTPYAFNYDMTALTAVLALMTARADNTRADRALILTVWAMPVVMMFGFFPGIAGSALVLLAFGHRLFRRLGETQPSASSAGAANSAAVLSIT
jgi:hypothetical protein